MAISHGPRESRRVARIVTWEGQLWALSKALVLVLVLSLPAAGQVTLASVTGVVTDAQDAVIPDAAVLVRNVDTGVENEVRTNETGYYTVLNLIPGTYELEGRADGFQRVLRTGLELETAQNLRLDLSLQLGSLSETVTVAAPTPTITLEQGAAMGDVIVFEEIQDLPLLARDFTELAFLIPGVLPGGRGAGSFASINGARSDQTNFYVDGVSNRNPVNGGANVRPPLDAVEEFRVETSGISAEYGGYSGGIVGVTMRSGKNKVHGSVFEYLRHNGLDARGFFDRRNLNLRRHQYGGTIGGPIVRNRSFFLGSFEGRYQSLTRTRLGRVPTPLERVGDFSETVVPRRASLQLEPLPIYLNDPELADACSAEVLAGCFPNNVIPATRIDSIGGGLVGLYPEPNSDDFRRNSISTATDADQWYQTVVKVDHRFSARDNFSVSYQKRFNNLENPFAGSALPMWGDQTRDRRELISVRHAHARSSSVLMQFTGGFSRRHNSTNSIARVQDGGQLNDLLPPDLDPSLKGLPRVTVQDYWPLGQSQNTPRENAIADIQVAGKITVNHKGHSIKAGLNYSRVFFNMPQINNARGNFRFGKRFTSHSVGDMLLGRLQSVNRRVRTTYNELRVDRFGMFFNDDWKVMRQLTLNLGLRYEMNLPPYDVNDRLSNYLPSIQKVVISDDRSFPELDQVLADHGLTDRTVLASEVGMGRGLLSPDFNNVAPRLGFAWRPFKGNRMVFRGGYGIFYQGYLLGPVRSQLAGTFPFTFNETFNASGRAQVPPPTLQNPYPQGRSRTGGSGIQNVNGFDPHPPTAYLQRWNMTIERDLGGGQALELGYVGSKGTHLQRRYNLNQPLRIPSLAEEGANGNLIFPRPIADFNNVQYTSFGSNSTHHAFQASIRRRSRTGFFYRLNYTFGKSLDDSSSQTDNWGTGAGGAADIFNLRLDRGRSNFDRRHGVTFAASYGLPVGRNRWLLPKARGAAQALLGGWMLSATMRAYTGAPFTVRTANVDLNAGESVRPNRIRDGFLPADALPGRKGVDFAWYDLTAFERVPCAGTTNRNGIECFQSVHGFLPFQVGNSGRNILDMPGLTNLNMSLRKRFQFKERRSLQLRIDAFNALNMTMLGTVNNQAAQFDSLQGGLIARARSPRRMQLSLSYRF